MDTAVDRFAGVRDSGRSGASVEMAAEERVGTLQTGVQKLAGCARRTVEVDTHPLFRFDAHDGSSVETAQRSGQPASGQFGGDD